MATPSAAPLRASIDPPITLRIGTRTSKLALWQTRHLAALLEARWPHLHCEEQHIVTQGDRRLDRPLPEIGGKGLFTAELEAALLDQTIDLAVHSLKDLPVEDAPGLVIGAILSREDVRDVLIAREGDTLATLPRGARVGTSSLRRQAQLLAFRPDLDVQSIRGNVDTRLRKVLEGDYHAAVMAGAGIHRLGLDQHISEWLTLELMLPAPGQGALAVQCRADDRAVIALLAALDDAAVRKAVTAERQLLWQLGGGCSAPIGALATATAEGLRLQARVAAVDGSQVYTAEATGNDPHHLAETVAIDLRRQGAEQVLKPDPVASSPGHTSVGPLMGKRIVVTRAEHQADELMRLLRDRGGEPILVPLIRIAPLADQSRLANALAHIDTYDWVLFTSVNAAETFWLLYQGLNGQRAWQGPRIAAIGPATAAMLQQVGLPVDAMPQHFLAEDLATALGEVVDRRVLLPRSARGKADLPEALAALGATVDDIPIYQTEPLPMQATARAQLRSGFHAITFTSGSTVQAFVAAVEGDVALASQVRQSTIACIGPTTAAVAASFGIEANVIAAEHTAAGLVHALVEHFANNYAKQ